MALKRIAQLHPGGLVAVGNGVVVLEATHRAQVEPEAAALAQRAAGVERNGGKRFASADALFRDLGI